MPLIMSVDPLLADMLLTPDDDTGDCGIGCLGLEVKLKGPPNIPCDPDFKRGKPHLQHKFCPSCRPGFAVPGECLRAIPDELQDCLSNTTRAGFWSETLLGGVYVQFRVINQHSKRCQGEPLIFFNGIPPAEPLPGVAWPPLPDGIVRPTGEVWLRVVYGTLSPIYAWGPANQALKTHLSGTTKRGSKRALEEPSVNDPQRVGFTVPSDESAASQPRAGSLVSAGNSVLAAGSDELTEDALALSSSNESWFLQSSAQALSVLDALSTQPTDSSSSSSAKATEEGRSPDEAVQPSSPLSRILMGEAADIEDPLLSGAEPPPEEQARPAEEQARPAVVPATGGSGSHNAIVFAVPLHLAATTAAPLPAQAAPLPPERLPPASLSRSTLPATLPATLPSPQLASAPYSEPGPLQEMLQRLNRAFEVTLNALQLVPAESHSSSEPKSAVPSASTASIASSAATHANHPTASNDASSSKISAMRDALRLNAALYPKLTQLLSASMGEPANSGLDADGDVGLAIPTSFAGSSSSGFAASTSSPMISVAYLNVAAPLATASAPLATASVPLATASAIAQPPFRTLASLLDPVCADEHGQPQLPSAPPSPPQTPAARMEDAAEVKRRMNPVTLRFADDSLETDFRTRAAAQAVHISNGANLAILIAFVAAIVASVSKRDPKQVIWPFAVPATCNVVAITANLAIGKLGVPSLEHRLLVLISVLNWASNALVFAAFYARDVSLNPIYSMETCIQVCVTLVMVAIVGHYYAFDFWARLTNYLTAVIAGFALPRTSGLPQQRALVILMLAIGDVCGYAIQRSMRLRYLTRLGQRVTEPTSPPGTCARKGSA